MSKETIMECRENLRKSAHTLAEYLAELLKLDKISGEDLMDISDMLKDMSKVEKNLAEADYYDRKIS